MLLTLRNCKDLQTPYHKRKFSIDKLAKNSKLLNKIFEECSSAQYILIERLYSGVNETIHVVLFHIYISSLQVDTLHFRRRGSFAFTSNSNQNI